MYIMLCVEEYSIGNVCKLMGEEQNLLECRLLLIHRLFIQEYIQLFSPSMNLLPLSPTKKNKVLLFYLSLMQLRNIYLDTRKQQLNL